MGVVVLHSPEDDQGARRRRPLPSPDLGRQYLERPAKAQPVDLVHDELPDRIPDGDLHFTNADDTGLPGIAADDDLFREEVGLGPASPAERCLVPCRVD